MVASKTAKKPAAKKSTKSAAASTTRKQPVKKAVAKSVTTKKPTTKKAAVKKPEKMKSFHIYKDGSSFTALKPTRQTLYWIILLIFIVIIQLWILKLQFDVAEMTNSIYFEQ